VSARLIYRTAASPSREIAECLEGLLLSELLDSGDRMLVVSPYMSDFPAIDNRDARFTPIEPAWGAAFVSFSQVLRALLARGVSVKIACGPGRRESDFVARVETAADLDATRANLVVHRMPHEHRVFSHEKALITNSWAVYGSMNLTYSGVTMNGELITVTTDPNAVARVATELLDLFE